MGKRNEIECLVIGFPFQTKPIIADANAVICLVTDEFPQIRDVWERGCVFGLHNSFQDSLFENGVFKLPQFLLKLLPETNGHDSSSWRIASRETVGVFMPSSIRLASQCSSACWAESRRVCIPNFWASTSRRFKSASDWLSSRIVAIEF